MATLSRLEGMLSKVATQTKRTAETDEFQQFSTPPTYAYLANWVANLNKNDTYLEPSAGIGGLAVFAKIAGVKEIVVNEFSPRRLGVLRSLPFNRFFAENAEQLNNVLPSDIHPTVIVMNPPFSATAGRMQGQRDTMNGAKHIEQALKRLASGGRLVAIVGEGMADDKPAFRAWWSKIKSEYDVKANIGIDGAGYVKYGTTFSNQILVIDKRGPTVGQTITAKVATPADALKLLEATRESRHEKTVDQETDRVDSVPPVQPGSESSGGTSEPGFVSTSPRPVTTDGVGSGRNGRARTGRQLSGGTSGNDAGSDMGGPVGHGDNRPAKSGQRGRGDSTGTARDKNAAGNSQGDAENNTLTVNTAQEEASAPISNSIFEQYTPKKVRIAPLKSMTGW